MQFLLLIQFIYIFSLIIIETFGEADHACTDRKYFKHDGPEKPGITIGLRTSNIPNVPDHPWAIPPFITESYNDIITKGKTFLEFEFPIVMMSKLTAHATFFDVGANNGILSLPIACMTLRHSVYSFEPVPSMVDYMCATKSFGNTHMFDSMRIIEGAVTNDTSKPLTLYVPFREDNTAAGSGNTAAINLNDKTVRKIEVPTITIDQFIEHHHIPKVSVLKIDVQGHEIFVLKGANKSFKNNIIQAAFVENDFKLMTSVGVSPQEIVEFMTSVGFVPYNPHLFQVGADGATFTVPPNTQIYDMNLKQGDAGFQYDVLWLPKP